MIKTVTPILKVSLVGTVQSILRAQLYKAA